MFLTDLGRPDLAKMVGQVPDVVLLQQVADKLSAEDKKKLEALTASYKDTLKVQQFVRYLKKNSPAKFPDAELLEALLHGVHPETSRYNKTLPLEEKVKLPDFELIYALNYKEPVNEKDKRHRRG